MFALGAVAPAHSTSSDASARSPELVPGSGPFRTTVGKGFGQVAETVVHRPAAVRKAVTSVRLISVWPITAMLYPPPVPAPTPMPVQRLAPQAVVSSGASL